MSITVCTFGSDRAFDETQSWPVGMAVGYLTLIYVTREPWFTIVFGFLWESFELAVLTLNQKYSGQTDSRFAQWFVDKGPLSWVVPLSADAKQRACVESPLTSLIYDPIIFIGATLLWHLGVEYLVGARYDTHRAFGDTQRRFLYYAAVGIATLFTSRTLFVKSLDQLGRVDRPSGLAPDLGLLAGVIAYIVLTFFIPLRSAQRNGYGSVEARRSYYSYVVYVLFVAFVAVVGILGGPFLNVQSSWTRSVLALAVLYAATILVFFARFCTQCASILEEHRVKQRKKAMQP